MDSTSLGWMYSVVDAFLSSVRRVRMLVRAEGGRQVRSTSCPIYSGRHNLDRTRNQPGTRLLYSLDEGFEDGEFFGWDHGWGRKGVWG